jgi:hypothetical protein
MLSYKNTFRKYTGAFLIKRKRRKGFLLIELLVALMFGFAFIFIALYFQSIIIRMYDQFLMHRIGLNLAVNSIEKPIQDLELYTSLQKETNISGRNFKICYGNAANVDGLSSGSEKQKVTVVWRSSAGKDEKLQLW